MNNYGYRDSDDKQITVRDNLIFCDTRDCVGSQSIIDTQSLFKFRGGRGEYSDNILNTSGVGITITIHTLLANPANYLKNGDKVSISGVQGNKAANGFWIIKNFNINSIGYITFELQGSIGNGNYAGGGTIIREADPGWPHIQDETSYIYDNKMIIKLQKKLKVIKSLSLINTVIPRDIIPLLVYLPDFLECSEFGVDDVPLCPQTRISTIGAGILASDFEVGDTIDDIVLVKDDRILIKDQVDSIENGIYIVQSSGAPIRSFDMLNGVDFVVISNYYVYITEGTINKDSSWVCDVTPSGTIGIDSLTFTIEHGYSNGTSISWVSYIPQEKTELERRVIGFYSTELQLFRTYIDGSFSIPNQHTPLPLKLWNPIVGGSTHQLQPYPHQTVPTYTSDNFSVENRIGNFYIILSGYGVYDLNDWTYRLSSNDNLNSIITGIARTLLLLVLTPNQSYNDEDYVSLIVNSSVTSTNTSSNYFGYGSYQRFIPGPGIGIHYQPGTSDGADPTIIRIDSPTPFPNFRGNVWGPYNSPGDRFQRIGLRDCLQDLYLNGDLANMFGTSIIKPWVNVECIPTDVTFGLYFPALTPVNFGNIEQATNINIVNAMRLIPNGYGDMSEGGASDIDSSQTKRDFGNKKKRSFKERILSNTEVVKGLSDNVWGDNEIIDINNRISWYDLGANSNNFITQIGKYRDWVITELPDTNIIISIFQAERDQRVQFINQEHTSCILSCPIRLNLGTSGTREYVENIQSNELWEKKYLPPMQSLHKLSIQFSTFGGSPIDLEKMLQPRRSVLLIQAFERIFGNTSVNLFSNVGNRENVLSFLFDPLDPRLVGREKRNISMIFKVQTYEYESPGLNVGIIKEMLESNSSKYQENHHPFIVRASNFQNYN